MLQVKLQLNDERAFALCYNPFVEGKKRLGTGCNQSVEQKV